MVGFEVKINAFVEDLLDGYFPDKGDGKVIHDPIWGSVFYAPKGQPKSPKYYLSVNKINRQEIDQALRNDITATRKKVIYKVYYTLRDENHKTLINNSSEAYLGYDILSDPYSTTFAQKKNEKNAAKIIANDISLRLGAYFHSLLTKRGNPDEY